MQKVLIATDTHATTLTGSVGLWYSDANDGTSLLNQGNLTAISSAFFIDTFAMATFLYQPGTYPSNNIGVTAPVEVTFGNQTGTNYDGVYLPSNSNVPVWQAVYNALVAVGTTNAAGAFTSSAGVISVTKDPGGFFDIGLQLTSTGSSANVKVTMWVDLAVPM